MLLTRNKKYCQGTTLVESLLAMLIMTIVALGGAAFIFFSSARIATERNKRVALEVANGRLEDLRAADFTDIQPLTTDYFSDYIDKSGGNWVVTDGGLNLDPNPILGPGENADINGNLLPMTTTVRYIDADGGSSSYDYLLVNVSVNYRLNSSETVQLSTYSADF
jgi:type II secretory pathway pseudopilin PulG